MKRDNNSDWMAKELIKLSNRDGILSMLMFLHSNAKNMVGVIACMYLLVAIGHMDNSLNVDLTDVILAYVMTHAISVLTYVYIQHNYPYLFKRK